MWCAFGLRSDSSRSSQSTSTGDFSSLLVSQYVRCVYYLIKTLNNCVVVSKRKVSDLSPAAASLSEEIFTFALPRDWTLFSTAPSRTNFRWHLYFFSGENLTEINTDTRHRGTRNSLIFSRAANTVLPNGATSAISALRAEHFRFRGRLKRRRLRRVGDFRGV